MQGENVCQSLYSVDKGRKSQFIMLCEKDEYTHDMYLCIARHKLLVSICIFGPQAIFEIASQGALDGEFKVLGCISLLIQSTKYSKAGLESLRFANSSFDISRGPASPSSSPLHFLPS